jgi:hypothetical protein
MVRRLYLMALSAILVAVLGVALPTIGVAVELASEGAPPAHRVVRHDHGFEGPLPLKVEFPPAIAAGTAMLPPPSGPPRAGPGAALPP